MTNYYYHDEKGNRVYIKDIDYAEGKLTFTTDRSEAFKDRDGYYANATRDLISRQFKEEYPEVANLQYIERYSMD